MNYQQVGTYVFELVDTIEVLTKPALRFHDIYDGMRNQVRDGPNRVNWAIRGWTYELHLPEISTANLQKPPRRQHAKHGRAEYR